MNDGDTHSFNPEEYDSLIAWSAQEIEVWPPYKIWLAEEIRYLQQSHDDPHKLELLVINFINSKISRFLQSQLLWDRLKISTNPHALLATLTLDIMDRVQPDLIKKKHDSYLLYAKSRYMLHHCLNKIYTAPNTSIDRT